MGYEGVDCTRMEFQYEIQWRLMGGNQLYFAIRVRLVNFGSTEIQVVEGGRNFMDLGITDVVMRKASSESGSGWSAKDRLSNDMSSVVNVKAKHC